MGLALLDPVGGHVPEAGPYSVGPAAAAACGCNPRPAPRPGARRCVGCGAPLPAAMAPGAEGMVLRCQPAGDLTGPEVAAWLAASPSPSFDAVCLAGRPLFCATGAVRPLVAAGRPDAGHPGGMAPYFPTLPSAEGWGGSGPGQWLGIDANSAATPFALLAWERRVWVYNAFEASLGSLVPSVPQARCVRSPVLAAAPRVPGSTGSTLVWAAAALADGDRLWLEAWKRETTGRWTCVSATTDRALADSRSAAGVAAARPWPLQGVLLAAPCGDGFDWWGLFPEGADVRMEQRCYRISADGLQLEFAGSSSQAWRPHATLDTESPPSVSMLDDPTSGARDGFAAFAWASQNYALDLRSEPEPGRPFNGYVNLPQHRLRWWRVWPGGGGPPDRLVFGSVGRAHFAALSQRTVVQADSCSMVFAPGVTGGLLLAVSDDDARALVAYHAAGSGVSAEQVAGSAAADGKYRFASAVATSPSGAWALSFPKGSGSTPETLSLHHIDATSSRSDHS